MSHSACYTVIANSPCRASLPLPLSPAARMFNTPPDVNSSAQRSVKHLSTVGRSVKHLSTAPPDGLQASLLSALIATPIVGVMNFAFAWLRHPLVEGIDAKSGASPAPRACAAPHACPSLSASNEVCARTHRDRAFQTDARTRFIGGSSVPGISRFPLLQGMLDAIHEREEGEDGSKTEGEDKSGGGGKAGVTWSGGTDEKVWLQEEGEEEEGEATTCCERQREKGGCCCCLARPAFLLSYQEYHMLC